MQLCFRPHGAVIPDAPASQKGYDRKRQIAQVFLKAKEAGLFQRHAAQQDAYGPCPYPRSGRRQCIFTDNLHITGVIIYTCQLLHLHGIKGRKSHEGFRMPAYAHERQANQDLRASLSKMDMKLVSENIHHSDKPSLLRCLTTTAQQPPSRATMDWPAYSRCSRQQHPALRLGRPADQQPGARTLQDIKRSLETKLTRLNWISFRRFQPGSLSGHLLGCRVWCTRHEMDAFTLQSISTQCGVTAKAE